MSTTVLRIAAVLLLAAGMPGVVPWPAQAAAKRSFRIGYLDNPGSALCRLALARGHFRREGLQVELTPFSDSSAGLAALKAGTIDAGAFSIGDSLRFIAAGSGFRIIAGGGTPRAGDPLTELDEALQAENEIRGIVVLVGPRWSDAGKGTLIRLTAALIRAYRTLRHHPGDVHSGHRTGAVHFDPNPDFYRLERIWRSLGLQNPGMKGDFLASHVYEEIYCDALDRLLDSAADDPVYRELSGKAVCTPDCCPKTKITKEESR